jgi:hypothetical protein
MRIVETHWCGNEEEALRIFAERPAPPALNAAVEGE